MKKSDILVGTIKKCNNLYRYKEYGEERYIGDFIIGHTKIGSTHKYVDTVCNEAILIKVNEDKYMWLNLLTSFTDEILANLGIPIKVINTFPSTDNDYFVDKNSLRPYFENNKNIKINVKILKKSIDNKKAIKK